MTALTKGLAKKKISQSRADRVFDIMNYVFLTICFLLVAYPLYFIVIASISDPVDVYAGKVFLLPAKVTMDGYKRILEYESFFTGYRNTLVYTVVGTLINVACTVPAAYALSRKDLAGRNAIMMMITFTMIFSGGLIPTYLLVLDLGLYDSMWALILPGMVSAWNLIVARTFVSHWNSYFNALIYLKDASKYPLQLVLRNILFENSLGDMVEDAANLAAQQRLGDLIKYGIIIASSLPLLILYPFLQRYFIQGVMIGAVKG